MTFWLSPVLAVGVVFSGAVWAWSGRREGGICAGLFLAGLLAIKVASAGGGWVWVARVGMAIIVLCLALAPGTARER